MYSGITLRPFRRFDAWFGAHQKIDRVARKHLGELLRDRQAFPSSKQIIRFEGINGPDGIKRKDTGNEPWHFIDPFDKADKQLLEAIKDHSKELTIALRTQNSVRAAFEAAWLSHAIVDGLTPAHHYPYQEELLKLRGGKPIEERTKTHEQVFMPGDTMGKFISNNWKMWGDRGLLATHFAFEWGVTVILMPLHLRQAMPTGEDIELLRQEGFPRVFRERLDQIAEFHLYDQFMKSGWTPKLAQLVRKQLVPLIISTVTLAWYEAADKAAGAA